MSISHGNTSLLKSGGWSDVKRKKLLEFESSVLLLFSLSCVYTGGALHVGACI